MNRYHIEQSLEHLRAFRAELRTGKHLEEDARRRAEMCLSIADSTVITNRLQALLGKKEE